MKYPKMSNVYLKSNSIALTLSAPSGCGKTSLTEALLKLDNKCKKSISFTTREKRGKEIDGVDYFFITRGEFENMKNLGQILEYTEIYGNFYGTPLKNTQDMMNDNYDVIFDICIKGASAIKEKYKKNAVTIFILPPSIEELEKRLKNRAQNTEEDIKLRLSEAEYEISQSNNFDYKVVNDNFQNALSEIHRILLSARENLKI